MKRIPFAIVVAVLPLALAGCRGKLVGTATLTGNGEAEARLQTTGGKLTFWADTDGKWTGHDDSKIDVRYDIEILQKGVTIGRLTCETNNSGTQICGSTSHVFGTNSGDCEIKLACPVPAIPAGETVFKVKATTGPSVKSVKKISLNVRGS